MSQFEPTGEQIAREVDLERYGDPEKARMRAALEELTAANERKDKALTAIGVVTAIALKYPSASLSINTLREIDQLARQGLAP